MTVLCVPCFLDSVARVSRLFSPPSNTFIFRLLPRTPLTPLASHLSHHISHTSSYLSHLSHLSPNPSYAQALLGDAADNVKGVDGIGKKTAALLLNQFGTLDAILEQAGTIKQVEAP